MSDKKTTESTADTSSGRRRLLKAIAGGGGALAAGASLPDKWKKPVIDTITLPAHAQTTPPADEERPDTTPVLSCSVRIDEDTGGPGGGSQTFTSDGVSNFGCSDIGVGFGGDDGCGISVTVTRLGLPVEGLTVEMEVTTTGGLFVQGNLGTTATAVTDVNGIASCFDTGDNDIFQIDNDGNFPDTATFCFSVVDRPDIIPCCITITFDCTEED